jgi:hypothetical protein
VIINRSGKNKLFSLKVIVGPGDEGEPVMTFMLQEED